MELYSQKSEYKLYHGNMLDMEQVIESGTIDSVVTDPPYELNFMGKGWDNSGIAFQKETWEKCLKALKPGGYLLAFGGSRTYHRIACAIEDAGFEIRDCIMWLYGSGFPKSMNIGLAIDKKNGVESEVVGEGKSGGTSRAYQSEEQTTAGEYQIKKASNKWNGWGTALKPSYEPIIVARKPLEGSCTDNVIKYGVGGINIDECRVGTEEVITNHSRSITAEKENYYKWGKEQETHQTEGQALGRFPANTIIDEITASGMPMGSKTGHRSQNSINNCIESRKLKKGNSQCDVGGNIDHITEYTDSGSVSRYFYCAKASKRDRDEGLDEFEEAKTTDGCIRSNEETATARKFGANSALRRNIHPTVKPTSLMQYLVRLVTPNGGTVLDPFNGSGSTGKAVMYENKDRNKNYKYIGIELTEEYLPIAKARIEYVINKGTEIEKSEPKEEVRQRKETALF